MTKSKKIIVPTDLSANSANAYNYAKELAELMNHKVELINFFYPNKATSELDTSVIPDLDLMMDNRKKELKSFINKLNDPSSNEKEMPPAFDYDVRLGFPTPQIIKLSKEDDTGFILMGTTGESGLMEQLLGSVSSKVSQKAHSPVWLVPPNVSFKPIKNILFASNYNSADGKIIKKITNLASYFEAKINLIHINDRTKKGDWEFEELMLEKLFHKKAPEYNYKLNTIQSEYVWKGLFDFAQEAEMDLIVIVTKHRNFWENLSHDSLTKKMVLNAVVPLLILHVDDV